MQTADDSFSACPAKMFCHPTRRVKQSAKLTAKTAARRTAHERHGCLQVLSATIVSSKYILCSRTFLRQAVCGYTSPFLRALSQHGSPGSVESACVACMTSMPAKSVPSGDSFRTVRVHPGVLIQPQETSQNRLQIDEVSVSECTKTYLGVEPNYIGDQAQCAAVPGPQMEQKERSSCGSDLRHQVSRATANLAGCGWTLRPVWMRASCRYHVLSRSKTPRKGSEAQETDHAVDKIKQQI